jgi:hypothetical protein
LGGDGSQIKTLNHDKVATVNPDPKINNGYDNLSEDWNNMFE